MDLNNVKITIFPKIQEELTTLFGNNVINYRPSDDEIVKKINKNSYYYSDMLSHLIYMRTNFESKIVIQTLLNMYDTSKTKIFLLIDGTNLWYTLISLPNRGGLNLDNAKAKDFLNLIFKYYTEKDIYIIIISQKTIGENFKDYKDAENITILNNFPDATELDDIFLVYFYYYIRPRQHVFIFSLDKFHWQKDSAESAESGESAETLLSKQEAKHFFEEMRYLSILNTTFQNILKDDPLNIYNVRLKFLMLVEMHSIQIVNQVIKTLNFTRQGQLSRYIHKTIVGKAKNIKKQRTRTKPKPKPKKQRTRTKPKSKPKPKKQRTRTKPKFKK